MVLVYLKNGDCIEHEKAITAEVQGTDLILRDERGHEVTRYDVLDVTLYSASDPHIRAIRAALCDHQAATA